MSKDIEEFKGNLYSAGGNYTELVRQLEAAKTELNQVEANLKSAETRHRSGATSSSEYKKMLANNQQRKEKAEAVIIGILLRLREESR